MRSLFNSMAIFFYLFFILAILAVAFSLTYYFSPFFLLLLIIIVPLFLELKKILGQNTYSASEDRFSQNGVVVDYQAKTIVINGRNYTLDDITGNISISWTHNTATADISVDDMASPIQRIKFYSAYAKRDAEEFVERFKAALRKISAS